jgi:phage tail sheath protein FI
MPVVTTYPGVYIEEVPSGVRTIAGVSTSIAMFIGRTASGPMDTPTRCLSYEEFKRAFSDDLEQSELPRAVKLFFDNGGSQCFVMRIAKTPAAAEVALSAEAGGPVLRLKARSAGVGGNALRAAIDYNTPTPEATFNLTLFRRARDARGGQIAADVEVHTNLSMDPKSARYAPGFVTQSSKLVDATAEPNLPAVTGDGFSQSGRPLAIDGGIVVAAWKELVKADGKRIIRVLIDGGLETVDLTDTLAATTDDALVASIASLINNKFGRSAVAASLVAGPTGNRFLRVRATAGEIAIQPGPDPSTDAAVALMLGTAQGGIEVGRYAAHRPAPTGLSFSLLTRGTNGELTALNTFAQATRGSIRKIKVGAQEVDVDLGTASDPIFKQSGGKSDGVRENLGTIAAAINARARAVPGFGFRAELWGTRLAILPTSGLDSDRPAATAPSMAFQSSVRHQELADGDDGDPPQLDEYEAAFRKIDRDVDLFNLLIIPADRGEGALDRRQIWGPASAFCLKRRALLLIDPPDEWSSHDDAVDPATGVSSLRAGLVKDHSAIFFPKLRVFERGALVDVDPAGAIAGLMARTDASRGIWKAPAGTEADLRGIGGVAATLANEHNGVLNQRAVNTIRLMPGGVVNWGARTMDGDDDFGSEWKYVPVRRLALYIEESLYRGLQWVVFEPNDEPLWAQVRLNLGTFMHSLFRQGAFQGKTPAEAYLVKCDKDTTTQDDINRGIVNALVGFAPLKPAEFVIVKIQQLAGQLAV